MGLAFGLLPDALGLGKEFIDSRPALSRIGIEMPPDDVPGAEAAATRRARKPKAPEGLPMPQMPNNLEGH
jgi:heterodisulfide reductase subunit B